MPEGKKSPIPSESVRNCPKIVGFRPFSSVLKNHGQKSILKNSAPDLPHEKTVRPDLPGRTASGNDILRARFLYTAMVQRITSGHIPADAYSALRLTDIIAQNSPAAHPTINNGTAGGIINRTWILM